MRHSEASAEAMGMKAHGHFWDVDYSLQDTLGATLFHNEPQTRMPVFCLCACFFFAQLNRSVVLRVGPMVGYRLAEAAQTSGTEASALVQSM